jgi:hypothetical protein
VLRIVVGSKSFEKKFLRHVLCENEFCVRCAAACDASLHMTHNAAGDLRVQA